MNKLFFLAAALVGAALWSSAVYAQSPWESGSYNHGGSNTPPADSNNTNGLQNYLMPAPAPAVPTASAPPTPTPVQPAPAASSKSSSGMPVVPNPQSKNLLGAATDTTFITIGLKSIDVLLQSSQLAQKNGSSSAMQQFAGQIISIYKPMQGEIQALAKKNNIKSINMTLSNDIDKLKTLSGADFDKQYMAIQEREFYQLSYIFSDEVKSGQNDALKQYAKAHISMLDQQKDMVQQSYMAAIQQGTSPMGPTQR